jgi:DNA invertase Pin-like site-specific DNA recombinase
MKRVAIYARVSTDAQTTDNQLNDLHAVVARMDWQVVGEYVDHAVSGAKGRDKRPQLDALMKAVERRRIDVVAAWSVDRLGRSLQHLVDFLGTLHTTRTDLYLHQQGIDTTTPGGKALFQMCGVFAEFERSMIQERVRAGLKRAREQGKRLGRPSVVPHLEARVRVLRKQGKGIIKIAREVGCGVGTVQKIIAVAGPGEQIAPR